MIRYCRIANLIAEIYNRQSSIINRKMPRKKSKTGKPQLHKELEGFEMSINEFGEIKRTMDIEKINEFLNRHVDDKKFKERNDQEEIKKGNFKKKKE